MISLTVYNTKKTVKQVTGETKDKVKTAKLSVRKMLCSSLNGKKETEKKYEDLFNLNPLPMWIYDLSTLSFLEVNEAAITHYGYSREEFLQMTLLDIRPATEMERFQAEGGKLNVERKIDRSKWRHLKKDGTIIHVEINAQIINYDGAKAALVLANDVSDKVEVENKYITTHRRLQTAMQIAKMGYWEYNLVTSEWFWSEQTYKILGWEKIEKKPDYASFLAMIHPDDQLYYANKQAEVLAQVKSVDAEYRIIMQDGEIKTLASRATLLFNEEGKAIKIEGVIQDVTERKRTENELLKGNERYLYATRATSDAIWDWDIINDHLYWGEGYEKLFGYRISSKIDNHIYSFEHIHPDDKQEVFSAIYTLINGTGDNWSGEYRYRMKNGEYAVVRDKAVVIRNRAGRATRMIGAMQDITEQKKAVEELAKERKLLRVLIDNLPDYIYVKDSHQRHMINNKANVAMLGFASEEETIGKTISDMIGDQAAIAFRNDDIALLSSGESILNREEPIITKDGVWRWLLTTKIPLRDDNEKLIGLVGISRDITDRKKAEEELKEKNHQLKELSRHLQQVREEERKFLAREVHDELGQLASAVKMDIDWLDVKLSAQNDVLYTNRIKHAASTASLMISTIRKIASDLRPGMLDELGLNASLEWKCNKFTSATGINCTFQSTVDDTKLESHVKTELFRICQESLTNVMRHANASEVSVSFTHQDNQIELLITDDGKGFDIDKKTRTLGLIGMRERCLSINGKLTISSTLGKGTSIRTVISNQNIMI